jgi:hypothetical protein
VYVCNILIRGHVAAAKRGSLALLETSRIWAKEVELNTDEFVFAQTWKGYTAFHLAAWNDDIDKLKEIWVRAEEKQHNQNELKKKLLLTTDNFGLSARNLAEQCGRSEAVEIILSWAKKEELKQD